MRFKSVFYIPLYSFIIVIIYSCILFLYQDSLHQEDFLAKKMCDIGSLTFQNYTHLTLYRKVATILLVLKILMTTFIRPFLDGGILQKLSRMPIILYAHVIVHFTHHKIILHFAK